LLLSAAGSDGGKALGQVPEDQLDRLKDQARRLGLARASSSADCVNDALTSMIGATSPRLHLELLAARLIAAGGRAEAVAIPVSAVPPVEPPPSASPPSASLPSASPPSAQSPMTKQPGTSAPAVATSPVQPGGPAHSTSVPSPSPEPNSVIPPVDGASDTELLRRRWPEVLGTLERRRVTWVLVSQSAQVASIERGEVRLAFSSPQLGVRFMEGNHAENVALAIRETLGLPVTVVVADSSAPSSTTQPIASTGGLRVSVPTRTDAATSDSASSAPTPSGTASDSDGVLEVEDDAAPEDAPAPDSQLSGPEVIAKLLGGTVVDER
jgi:DNA polymerase-3 subunit gamma/tau